MTKILRKFQKVCRAVVCLKWVLLGFLGVFFLGGGVFMQCILCNSIEGELTKQLKVLRELPFSSVRAPLPL